MPRSAGGTYTLPEAAFIAGTVIQSSTMNSDLSDIAAALTQSLATTGVSSMTGPIKAASGSVTAPSFTFANAATTGFYLSGADQISWTAAGVLQATLGATGAVTWVGGATWGGNGAFTGTLSSAAFTAATTGTPMTGNCTTNDASEHTLLNWKLGSGAGVNASIRGIGTGANDISQIRAYIDTTEILRWTASVVSPKKNISVDGGIIVITTSGYSDFTEIASPGAPGANISRVYSKDDGAGTTRYYHTDAAAVENVFLFPATNALMEAKTSNLVGVTPGTQLFHPWHPKAVGTIQGTTGNTLNGVGFSAVRTGAGLYTVTLTQAMSSSLWAAIATAHAAGNRGATLQIVNTNSFNVTTYVANTGTATDSDFSFAVFGDI